MNGSRAEGLSAQLREADRHDATTPRRPSHAPDTRRSLPSTPRGVVASWRFIQPSHRRGSILVLVAGVAALIAALTLAFLAQMRDDAQATAAVARDAQARLMLIAACNYIQEASRLGWEKTAAHEECFGWIDVRDGKLGPKPTAGADDDSRFPVAGAPRRFPMYRLTLPPYAVRPLATPNPIENDDAKPDFGMAYLRNPDPLPATANGWTGPGSIVSAANWAAFAAGDPRPVGASMSRAWFRLYRRDGDTFVVTCGAGASEGYRAWSEVLADGASARFGDDPAQFAEAQAQERRLHYLVQWSPAVATSDLHNPHPCLQGWPGFKQEHYIQCPMNTSHSKQSSPAMVTVAHCQNPVGTIRFVQRLREPPTIW